MLCIGNATLPKRNGCNIGAALASLVLTWPLAFVTLTGEQFRDRSRLSASASGSASPATSTGSGAAATFGSSPAAPVQAPPAGRPLGSSRLSVRLIDYEVLPCPAHPLAVLKCCFGWWCSPWAAHEGKVDQGHGIRMCHSCTL